MSDQNKAYLSLGSNLGDREENLLKARKLIEERVGVLAEISGLYETAPWGYESLNPFFNCCLSVTTSLDPVPLMEALLEIEKELGRIRNNRSTQNTRNTRNDKSDISDRRYSDRVIDIDILFYGDITLRHPILILPHPSMAQRRFILVPLADIAPEVRDPVLGLTVREMLDQCSDTSSVRRVEDQMRWNNSPSQNM
ncbi:MAG: 2-amino-4-hydroxy-6-hydroxymethyldihydropteridine diphosphokinase [Bacteroidales bacterium]